MEALLVLQRHLHSTGQLGGDDGGAPPGPAEPYGHRGPYSQLAPPPVHPDPRPGHPPGYPPPFAHGYGGPSCYPPCYEYDPCHSDRDEGAGRAGGPAGSLIQLPHPIYAGQMQHVAGVLPPPPPPPPPPSLPCVV
jgi:hypothetical protein